MHSFVIAEIKCSDRQERVMSEFKITDPDTLFISWDGNWNTPRMTPSVIIWLCVDWLCRR
jgi:hypothetical protein